MTPEKQIAAILQEIRENEKSPEKKIRLPQNTFFLSEGRVACLSRSKGESRYPYDADGLVVWAHAGGYISACESTFNIFRPCHYSEDAPLAFFAGIPLSEGGFSPISVLGSDRAMTEPIPVFRATVYAGRCAWYLADTEEATYALRLHVSADKHIHLAFFVTNKTKAPIRRYLASAVEALLRFDDHETFWQRMSKFAEYRENGSWILRSQENCLTINTRLVGAEAESEAHTAVKSAVLGGAGRCFANAEAWKTGHFGAEIHKTNTVELPLAADLLTVTIPAGGTVRREYDMSYSFTPEDAETAAGIPVDPDRIDRELEESQIEETAALSRLNIRLEGKVGALDGEALNRVIACVEKQVSFCALGKNYAGPMMGIRDVFQQLESALLFQPQACRRQILTAMNYILSDGRPPRQYSLPAVPGALPPMMDLRKFIDQGVWIISTLYSYLAYTGDFSLLDERCSYCVASEDNRRVVARTEEDTVLDHLLKIMAFLSSNIDREGGTLCLHVLHGDWNDALDALGKTEKPGKEFGTGVTVMATLQFYQNCREMAEILDKIKKYPEKAAEYRRYAADIEASLPRYAIDRSEEGKERIVHGWGDDRSYLLGSFRDPDGEDRVSATANAFWALSGMVRLQKQTRAALLDAFDRLASPYGILTFDKPFPRSMQPYAGRIATITPGTYENSCAYAHASMFSVMALFAIGESRRAWEELERTVILSHENCSMTPFVMPNSYCRNPEYAIDGESMGDWYTGSGTVLIKALVRYGLGLAADISGLTVQTPAFMPVDRASIELPLHGKTVRLEYRRTPGGTGGRRFTVNGKAMPGRYDDMMQTETLYLPHDMLQDGMTILVED